MKQQQEVIQDELDELKNDFNRFKSEVEARARYEEKAKEEAEKRFNRNIAIVTILVTIFGVVLPILINLLIFMKYGQTE